MSDIRYFVELKDLHGERMQCGITGCRRWRVTVKDELDADGRQVDRGVCRQHTESGLTITSTKGEVKIASNRRNTLSRRARNARGARPDRPNSKERRRLKQLGIRWQDR